MATPVLKIELQKFGVRPLPKKKMVKKLKEIYDYTHQVETLLQQGEKGQAVSDSQPASSNVVPTDVVDGVEESGTASSDNSDEEDTEFGDCTVMIEDEAITASQQANGGNLKEKLLSYVTSNKELYKKLLKFQPQELVSLHQQIKSDGINCSLGKLVDFLDEQCLTFTTAGSRPRAPRKGGRKNKVSNKS
ncbi:5'-flap endonuclease [Porites harrisoni]